MTALAWAPWTVSLKSQLFLSGCKDPDVALQKVVVDRHPAVFGVARQIFPLVERIGDGIFELGVGHNLRRDRVEPCLEGVQDRNGMFLAEAAPVVGLAFRRHRAFRPAPAFQSGRAGRRT